MESLKNLTKSERRKFEELNNLSRQAIDKRIKLGWKIGELNGKKVMYNPKHVQEIVEIEDDN